MKKKNSVLCIVLSLVMVLGLVIPVMAADVNVYAPTIVDRTPAPGAIEMRLSVTYVPEYVIPLAIQKLNLHKEAFMPVSYYMGFTMQELAHMQLGNPFTIYVFNEDFSLMASNVLVFPLLYQNNIIGIMESVYDTVSGNWVFTFGKSFADELNQLRYVDFPNRDFVIGRVGDVLFASNGESASVILDREVERYEGATRQRDVVTYAMMNDMASSFLLNFADVTTSIGGDILDIDVSGQMMVIPLQSQNPLPVVHVPQTPTGICGVAAWAAVLNFRFGTRYNNESLTVWMRHYGFTAVLPSMTDYRDYANRRYSAGVVYWARVPSINEVRGAIWSRRPMMGNWSIDGRKDTHAVNIIGYELPPVANLTIYLVLNPWPPGFVQSVTVHNNSAHSVVFVDGGLTMRLIEVIF